MAEKWVIIDGYNLAFHRKMKKAAKGDLESIRSNCVRKAEAFLTRAARITLVFDGRMAMKDNPAFLNPVIEVEFAQENQTADEHIIALVHAAKKISAAEILVFSDDRIVRHNAEAAGADTQSILNFLEECALLEARAARTASLPSSASFGTRLEL